MLLVAVTCNYDTSSFAQCSLSNLAGGYDICDITSSTNNFITLTATGGGCGTGITSWSSSNTAIATVAGSGPTTGIVTGQSAGNATITYQRGAITRTRAVVVHAPTTPTITGVSNVCHLGTPTVTLTGTPAAGGVWSASNVDATVVATTGVVTGVNAGSVIISYHHTNVNGCTDYDTHPMTIDPTPNAGVISGPLNMWTGVPGIITLTSSGGTGGIWSSTVPGVGTIDPITGVLRGFATGNTTISYT